MKSLRLLFVLCLAALGTEAAAQPIGPATDYVRWTASATPAVAAPGDAVQLMLEATIDAGWKMYALDSPPPSRGVQVTLDALPPGVTVQGAFAQEGNQRGYDPNFQKEVSYFARQARVWAMLAVADAAPEGAHRLSGIVQFMICNDRLCLPPVKVPFAADLQIGAATASQPGAGASPPALRRTGEDSTETLFLPGPPSFVDGEPLAAEQAPAPSIASTEELRASRAGGFWAFLLLAAAAGLAALLTPCVFPMIPLTVSYFTKHSDDRGEALRMASVYGFAIVATFTGLGVLMAALVGAAGAQSFAANPWVNLFIGVVFVVFAMSLLGLFELRLPTGLLNFFNRQSSEKQGYVGVLFMGFTLTLVSFSCTAPFVGGLLAATAAGSWSYPVLGMVVFSTTFSLPFVFFALFPRALSTLPKSGSWMNVVKVVLGFVELAAALKFLSNADLVWGWGLISRTLAIALCVVIFALMGLYLLGKLRLSDEPEVAQVGVGRLMTAIGSFGLALYLLPGLFGAPLNALDAYLPPRQADDVSLLATLQRVTSAEAAHSDEAWIVDDVEAAYARAEAEGKPVMIDFTGYTCTNCRQMEANVFPRPEIAERFQRDFVLLRLYTDGLERGQDFQRFQLKLTGTVALPTYAIVDPAAPERVLRKVSGTLKPGPFAAFLDAGSSTFIQNNLAAD